MTLAVRILAGRLDHGAGSHVYHMQLARRFVARGHRVSVISFSSHPDVADCAEVTEIPRQDYDQSPLVWRIASLRRYWQCSRAVHSAELDRPDVVIGGEHLLLKAHFRRFPDVPWIYLPHAMTVTEEIRHYQASWVQRTVMLRLYRHLQRWALARSSCVVRFTMKASQALERAYPGTSARFAINPIGVELPTLPHVPAPDGVPRLLIVGQLIYRKGVDIALRALANMRELKWSLSIVGEGGLRAELERYVASAGLSDRVLFAGHVVDPSRWYLQSDLLLFPSRSESLGLVLLEAMASGVPCLAFRADDRQFANVNEEIIQSGKTGLLVANEEEFRRVLQSVLEDPASLNDLGQACRMVVSKTYSWERHIHRYETLFADLRGVPVPL